MKKAIIIFFILMFTMSPVAFAATKYYQVYTPDEYAENDYIQANQYVVIMLLVDYSSSMVNWINLAKDVLKTVVPEIPSNTKVGLRVFGQGVPQNTKIYSKKYRVYVSGPYFTSKYAREELCKFTKLAVFPRRYNNSSIIAGLDSAKIGNLTPLTYALKETVNKDLSNFYKKSKKKIILVTDGFDTCDGDPCAYIKSLVASRRDIVIDVIAIGGNSNLRCLSEATKGDFYYINSRDPKIFSKSLIKSIEAPPKTNTKPKNKQIHYRFVPLEQKYEYD